MCSLGFSRQDPIRMKPLPDGGAIPSTDPALTAHTPTTGKYSVQSVRPHRHTHPLRTRVSERGISERDDRPPFYATLAPLIIRSGYSTAARRNGSTRAYRRARAEVLDGATHCHLCG